MYTITFSRKCTPLTKIPVKQKKTPQLIHIYLSNCEITRKKTSRPRQSCKNVQTVQTSRCYYFWPVLIFGKSTRKTGENTRKQAKTGENRRKTGAFLVLIFLREKLVGANFYAFCNYDFWYKNTIFSTFWPISSPGRSNSYLI